MADDDARQVLKTDLLAGGAAVAAGLLSEGVAAVLALPVVTAGFALLVALVVGAAEHGLLPGVYPEATALAGLVALVAVAAALTVSLSAPTGRVVTAVVVGGGLGILAYRTVFGLLRPVPERRRTRTARP